MLTRQLIRSIAHFVVGISLVVGASVSVRAQSLPCPSFPVALGIFTQQGTSSGSTFFASPSSPSLTGSATYDASGNGYTFTVQLSSTNGTCQLSMSAQLAIPSPPSPLGTVTIPAILGTALSESAVIGLNMPGWTLVSATAECPLGVAPPFSSNGVTCDGLSADGIEEFLSYVSIIGNQISVQSNHYLSGSSVNGVPYSVVYNQQGGTAIAQVVLQFVPSTALPFITTQSLPGGTMGTPYSQTLTATGGRSPYTWSILAGTLPPGLSMNTSTGAITGTPTTAGTFNFTVQVTDSAGAAGLPAALSIQVGNISAPTNLQASQFGCSIQTGCSGTTIQVTWDYPADVSAIDGFELVRQTPSETFTNTWEAPTLVPTSKCTPVATGATCTYPDTVAAYTTYSYQVRAYKGANDSDYSNTDTAFQLMLSTMSNNREMLASFQPDPSIGVTQVANIFGYNHFNWVSVMTHVPNSAVVRLVDFSGNTYSAPPPPLVDPAIGGWKGQRKSCLLCQSEPADFLPYYWDEQSGFDPRYSVFNPAITSAAALFADLPNVSLSAPANEYYTFTTELVGAKNAFDAVAAQYEPLATFYWSSNFHGSWGGGVGAGGITDFRFSNLDLPPTTGPGGIFNPQVFGLGDLPLDVRSLLIQTGAQGVSMVPKVDKDAPTTAAFPSGQQGTNGWYTGPVNVILIATDIDGPSDIGSTAYNVDAGSSGAYTGPFTVSGDGVHTIRFGSVDLAGNVETPRPTQTIEIDATPPNFATFPTSLTVPPTGTGGAAVTYALPTATDATSGISATGVSCAPASGSTFPLGTTRVTCKVADNAGNVTTGTFNVTVHYNFAWTMGKAAPALNSADAGDGYKIAFNVGGNFGLNVVSLLTSAQIACGGPRGAHLPGAEGRLGLSYNSATGSYQETFAKPGHGAAGTCAQISVTLNDGTTQVIEIKYGD